ncbi:MAG: CBS domain-containing protein [Gloeocapsa sp. DLM2.Bin57]|nr:MAG: CBS domain-containing protein [Gloeocapsa sp. DLM2.Bin57]
MLKASQIMTTEVVTIRGSATVAEAVKLMKLHNLQALVVDIRNSQDAYGIITNNDIVTKVVAYGKDTTKVRVYEVMTKPCIVVNPDLGVEYIARLFAQTGIRIAPVIQGELLGIISERDILHKGDFVENPKAPLLKRELARAIEEARSLAAINGATSPSCLEAWALVDELETEIAYQNGDDAPEMTAFQVFCAEHPEVLQIHHKELVNAQ